MELGPWHDLLNHCLRKTTTLVIGILAKSTG